MSRNRGMSENARNRKELKKIQLKLNGYINAFMSICYFDEKKLDWNIISEQEFIKLKGKWKWFCKGKGYSEDIIAVFHWECMLLKTDLILQTKYDKEADKNEILVYLKKGMTPLEVADYVFKNLKTTEV